MTFQKENYVVHLVYQIASFCLLLNCIVQMLFNISYLKNLCVTYM